MANLYSDHYSRSDSASTVDVGFRPTPGSSRAFTGTHSPISHARTRKTIAHYLAATTLSDNDVIRMFSIKSGDRLVDMTLSTVTLDAATTLTFDVGLYKSGASHDGAEVDMVAFASAIAGTSPPVTRVEALIEAATVSQFDRGKTAWEFADAGAATYTDDPGESWDVCIQVNTTGAVTAGSIMLEAEYSAGD